MTSKLITAANPKGGGQMLASFGSGDGEGTSAVESRSAAGERGNSSAAEVSSVRSAINRAQGVTPGQKRRLLQEIELNAKPNGAVDLRILADIRADLRDLAT